MMGGGGAVVGQVNLKFIRKAKGRIRPYYGTFSS